MTAQSDYQQALKQIADLATAQASRVSGFPHANSVSQILYSFGGTIAGPLIDDLKAGAWKKWQSWQLAGSLSYLSSYGTSAAVAPLRDIEKNYNDSVIQDQAKDLADLLATLDVAVSEARKLQDVQNAISSGDKDRMAREMLLALAQLDPDWPKRAAAIQSSLFDLADDSFPAINELASGALSKDDVSKALVEILFPGPSDSSSSKAKS
ncbi:hypothetical protein [uncultured Thalassospira sp.]|uniref:hypothetical protein n=1 Tax=uncultured Thalassospira sp. TaxID=404382 RepID=UPI0025877358|nr:hypothetical protein [uncultured Thalassospira sp.]